MDTNRELSVSGCLCICLLLQSAWLPAAVVVPEERLDAIGSYRLSNRMQCRRMCWYRLLCTSFSYYGDSDEDFNCVLHSSHVEGSCVGLLWCSRRHRCCCCCPSSFFFFFFFVFFLLLLLLPLLFLLLLINNHHCYHLSATWLGCYGLCSRHKPAELAHTFLFCSCVCFCLYGPLNCTSFH